MEGEILPPEKGGLPAAAGAAGALVPVKGGLPAVANDDAPGKRGKKAKPAAPQPPVSNRETMAKGYVERMVNLLSEKAELSGAIADLATEIKGAGFSPGAIKRVASEQLETADQRAKRIAIEDEADQIRAALGMLADTPLGEAAAA